MLATNPRSSGSSDTTAKIELARMIPVLKDLRGELKRHRPTHS